MGQVDALRLVEEVRRRMVDLAVSDNYIRDEVVAAICRRAWEGADMEGGLVSEIWVEGAFPAEIARQADGLPKALGDMVAAGQFPRDLAEHLERRGSCPLARSLFAHQERSIVLGGQETNRPALVITAPTGAGKTEAFLLPILKDLWAKPERTPGGGMRCLILYPMNALVTDQVERLYGWLREQERLTVFHFNSETPEDTRQAIRWGEPRWEACRKRTRQEARGLEGADGRTVQGEALPPPDIVITNYSMLEYMLCRPRDACFFGRDLRAIVLDEAHLYSGTLAAEITLLLRRVRLRCGVQPDDLLQIATSATLGGDDGDLKQFAGHLFARHHRDVTVVRGQPAPLSLPAASGPSLAKVRPDVLAQHADMELSTLTPADDFVRNATVEVSRLAGLVKEIADAGQVEAAVRESPDVAAPFLKRALERSPIVQRLAGELFARRIVGLPALAAALWGGDSPTTMKATTLLLRLCAAARAKPDALPVIPHRLHFLVRGPEGLSCCLNEACSGPQESMVTAAGSLQAAADRCRYCLSATLPMHRCDTCGEWALVAFTNSREGLLEPGYFVAPGQRSFYLLLKRTPEPLLAIRVDPATGEFGGASSKGTLLYKAPCPDHHGECRDPATCSQQECPSCHRSWTGSAQDNGEPSSDRNCVPIRPGDRLGISVVAETMLHGLPPIGGDSDRWKPAQGRRLLCFSDSRREAARLGPHLTSQHEIWIVRAAVGRLLEAIPAGESADYYRREVRRHEQDLSDPSLGQASRIIVERKLNDARRELQMAEAGIGFLDLAGLLSKDSSIRQILDPEHGDAQRADQWKESTWQENTRRVSLHAEALLGRELEGPARTKISLESMGMAEICYPGVDALPAPPELVGRLPNQKVREGMEGAWPAFIGALLDSMRTERCLAWSEETAGRTWEGESPLWARWATQDKAGWGAIAFVGDLSRPVLRRQNRLRFARAVLLRTGCGESEAEALAAITLTAAFDQLLRRSGELQGLWWIAAKEAHQVAQEVTRPAIQILLDRLAVRPPRELFLCPDTGTLWARSVLGYAPIRGCGGNLRPVSAAEADEHPRWGRARREVRTSAIFQMGLWSEEHSAQLDATENKRRQLLFKEGIRNILSSTTTMELGIDVGGLNGVLMGNVPPSRANHMQRAGRAGRRSDGSAVVATFARERAFDREVFRRFGEFLSKPFRRPAVFLDRPRLTRRHIHALLLGEFFFYQQERFAGAMQAYGDMGRFCGLEAPAKWSEQKRKPQWELGGRPRTDELFLNFLKDVRTNTTFARRLTSVVAGTSTDLEAIGDGGPAWAMFLDKGGQQFMEAVRAWNEDVSLLSDAWLEIRAEPTESDLAASRAQANAIRYQIDARCRLSVIEWLAGRGFLPRYGFPINLQHLLVRIPRGSASGQSAADERYRLERPAHLALNEYVPGAEVVIGGNVVTSRGILKHWTDSNRDQALGLQYRAFRCERHGHLYIRATAEVECPECGSPPIPGGKGLLFPRFGYTTAGWEPPRRGGRAGRIGEVEAYPSSEASSSEIEQLAGGGATTVRDFGGVRGLTLEYREEAELLIQNEGESRAGFAVCTRCGFAASEEKPARQGVVDLPNGFRTHAPVFRSRPDRTCWPKTTKEAAVLRNRVLAARERADMLLLDWPNVGAVDTDGLFSLGRALLLAGCKRLEIDVRELDVRTKPSQDGRPSLVLYETVAGGAGHCQELAALGRDLLSGARDLLVGTQEHRNRCRRACIECLLDFAGQFYAKKLDRIGALNILESALL